MATKKKSDSDIISDKKTTTVRYIGDHESFVYGEINRTVRKNDEFEVNDTSGFEDNAFFELVD